MNKPLSINFISGPPRSGSHFINRRIVCNPYVVGSPHESHFLQDLAGQMLYSRKFWNRNLNFLLNNYNLYRGLKFWGISESDFKQVIQTVQGFKTDRNNQTSHLIKSLFDLYFVRNCSDISKVIVEKSPTNIFYSEFILKNIENSRLICTMRHPMDCIMSLSKLGEKDTFWVDKDLEKQVAIWVNFAQEVKKTLSMENLYPNRILLIKYESLITDEIQEFQKIFAQIGCEINNEQIAQILNQEKFTLNNSNSRAYFTSNQLKYIDNKCRELATFFGYSLD